MASIIDRLLSVISPPKQHHIITTQALVAIGALATAQLAYRVFQNIYIYGRPSSLHRYARQNAWALITGASDGIGRGFARELASHGFHIILHGRNATKLELVRDELATRFPSIQTRLLIIDAATAGDGMKQQIETAVAELTSELDGPLTVLVNNVGGTGPQKREFCSFGELESAEIDAMIDLNARFGMQLTRALMPLLLKSQPGVVLNVSSAAALTPFPWLTVYSATKAFGERWSNALSRDFMADGYDLEAMALIVGKVTGVSHNDNVGSLFEPDGDVMARSCLARVGCGRLTVVPYWPHALQVFVTGLFPEGLLNKIAIGAMVGQRKEYEARAARKLE